jgi:hypothetical protein
VTSAFAFAGSRNDPHGLRDDARERLIDLLREAPRFVDAAQGERVDLDLDAGIEECRPRVQVTFVERAVVLLD